MFQMLIAAPVAALMTMTAPVVTPNAAPTPGSDLGAPAATAAAPVERQRVCVEYKITGSLLPYRQCQTRAEWRAMGEDALANAH